MKLELSSEEARFLQDHLARHIAELSKELAYTEKRPMQHALAQDVDRLTSIERRLTALIESGGRVG